MVPQGRDGAEKGQALGERTEERKEKGAERELDGALSSTWVHETNVKKLAMEVAV